MRESPLVVNRANRNPDTFVELTRTYARFDKQDRYDRYSRPEEIYADRPRIDGSPRVRRFRSRTFARTIVQP